MKNIKIIAVFVAILVALSVVICACGKNKTDNGNETTVGGNDNEVTTSKGNSNNDTTEEPEETTLGGYVESEVITLVEVTIEE